jgi:UPF0755 protein
VSRRLQAPQAQPLSLARRLTIAIASGLATLAIAVVVAAVLAFVLFAAPGPAARHGKETTVILRHGAGVQEIAAELEDKGAINSAALFVAAAEVTGAGRSLKAGEYAFPSRASLAQVLERIRLGRIVRHMITIPEGMTSEQAVEALMASDVLTGSAPAPPEGSLLPETYEVTRGEDRAAVLERMLTARDKLMEELWPRRRAGLPFNTPEEALVLASIVEKETGKADERPRVAAVFVNRLQKGLRLESDPTVIYALTRGKPLGRGIRQSELTMPSPYNTYLTAGLPPTPICNPGRASIAAVLDPPKTDELYFVADGTGGHVFSKTYEEHQRNVAHWRQVEPRSEAPPPVQPPRKPLRGVRHHARR